MQLEKGLDSGFHLLAVVALRPGEWGHQSDLDRFLGANARGESQCEGRQDNPLHS